MSKLNKILLLIFVIVFIASIVEFGYYFFNIRQGTNFFTKQPNLISSTTNEPQEISASRSPQPSLDSNQAIPRLMLINLSHLRQGVVKSSIINNQLQGEIIELDTKGGQFQGFNFLVKLKIKAENGQTNEFFYGEEELKKTKIVEVVGNQEKPIDIQNLKLQDKLEITESFDLLNVVLLQRIIKIKRT
jgi:hypothetical protein